MKILFCDDERTFSEHQKSNVEEILANKNLNCEYYVENDANAIYNSPEYYDIAFIDIEMPGHNGLEIASKLIEINPHLIIFIVTAYSEYLDDAMDLDIFRYLSKPVQYERLQNGIEKALLHLNKTKISIYSKNSKELQIVDVNDILYVEIIGRTTKVVTINAVYESLEKISFWQKELPDAIFFQIHKSYIVNVKNIKAYKRDSVTLVNNIVLPISYRTQSSFKSFYFQYLSWT